MKTALIFIILSLILCLPTLEVGAQAASSNEVESGANSSKALTKPVLEKHRRCYADGECALSRNSCCGVVSVNKAFVKIYELKFDDSACKAIQCAPTTAICVEQQCRTSRAR